MLEIVLVICFFLVLGILAYIKIKYPFWNLQPVFHTYDYWRYAYSMPFLVYPHQPIKTKFYRSNPQIQTIPYLECSQAERIEFLKFIQCYHISAADHLLYNVDSPTLDALLTGTGEPAFVTFMYSEFPNDLEGHHPLIAAMASRHVHLILFSSTDILQDISYPIYMIEYQTVRRDVDTISTHRTLLQTHEYNQRIENPNVLVTILKKEIQLLEGVIPLLQYMSTTYALENKHFPVLPLQYYITQIGETTAHLLTDFFYSMSHENSFSRRLLCMYADIGSLLTQIKARVLFVSCLRRGNEICAFYFWKDAKTQYIDENRSGETTAAADTIHSTSTIMVSHDIPLRLFYLGFLHALQGIIKQSPSFRMLIIDDLADTHLIHAEWRTKYAPLFSTPAAYYTFNLICPQSPFAAEQCLIVI